MTDVAAQGPESRPLDEPGIDLWAVLRVIRRRRWIAIGAAAFCLTAGVLWTVRSPRIYQAKALVLIEMKAPQVLNEMKDVYDLGTAGYWSTQEYYQTQYKVIASRPVVQAAVVSLGISTTALAEALRTEGPESIEARAASDPLHGVATGLREKLALVGLDKLDDRDAMLAALDKLDPVALIQARVQVTPVKDSRLVEVAIEDTDPERAALVANAVVDAYIQHNLDQKIETTRSAVDWLSDQMDDLRNKVEQSELALHEFKVQNRMVAVSLEDTRSMTTQTLTQLNEKLSSTRAERLSLTSRLRQLQQATTETDPDAIAEIIADPLVLTLKGDLAKLNQEEIELANRYTAEHPKLITVRKQIAATQQDLTNEVRKVIASVERQYRTVLDTEQRLQAAVDETKAQALEINKKEITYNRLLRDRDNNLELYQIVIKREKEANLTRMLNVNNVSKLEAALAPGGPIRPRVLVNLVLALMLGLISGIGLAFVVDYLDNRIKTQEQIEQLVGLPFLGILPTIAPDKSGATPAEPRTRDHFITQNPHSSVAECCRTIRTNILFMSPENPARSILITSGGPREGKSTTVVNLAIAMAQAGARVVVVDTDMRRPRLHKSFGINSAGISAAIVGEAKLDDVIQPTGIERLDFVPCGPVPPNPAELLLTERFKAILRELGDRYDRVLMDSPPILAVTDALVLASMMDGVVLVANAGETTVPATLQAKRRIHDVGGRIFGVVLNEVDLERKEYSSYYAYYYHYRPNEPEGGGAAPVKA